MFKYDKIKTDIGDLDEDAVIAGIKEIIEGGGDAQKVMQACQDGMITVGDRFETGEYFIGDLIFAGEIMQAAAELLKPHLSGDSSDNIGKIIFCTVQGDIHDIGKNIVRTLLESGGFDVIDLGVDVPAQKVANAIRENGAKIVALSGVLTLAVESMKKTVELLAQEGLRDGVKIIVGGACISADSCEIIGADAWAYNPQDGVKICREWALG